MTFRRRSRPATTATEPVVEFGHLRRALSLQLEAVRALAGSDGPGARVAYQRAVAIERELTAGDEEA